MNQENQVAILDATAFRVWLKAHSAQVVGLSADEYNCPVARFLSHDEKQQYYGVGHATYWRVGDDARVLVPLPAWVVAFVRHLDFAYPLEEVAGWQALKILDEVSHA